MDFQIPKYSQCVTNLNSFMNSLMKNPVKILFLYFTVKKKPYVRTKFGKWELPNKDVMYVLPGDDENFAYVYRDTELKAMIDIVDPNSPDPFDASYNARAPVDHRYEVAIPQNRKTHREVAIGNHLDFSIRRFTRDKHPVLVISTHLTKYVIESDGSVDRQVASQTDFTLEGLTGDELKSMEKFSKIHHEIRGKTTGLSIKSLFENDDSVWIPPFYHLTKITLGLPQSGGSQRYKLYGRHRYLIHTDTRQGEYIMVKRQRKYLNDQHGGAPDLDEIVMSERFSDLLYDVFTHPMQRHSNLLGMKVYFDYGQELTEDKDGMHLVLLYEYGTMDIIEHVNIFVIDGRILLNAIEEKNRHHGTKHNYLKLVKMAETCKRVCLAKQSLDKHESVPTSIH